MATTRIIPMHLNKGKTIVRCLHDRTDYAKNPDKTAGGELISSFACDPDFVASEFAVSKREYLERTGRVQLSDVIAYQLRQSFKPGEVSPEEANRIGYEFAERFLKGNHAFIVCTHVDKAHIHNHIIWNSTSLDCTRKFRNFWKSTDAVRRLSDQICAEHRLSVIENPGKHGQSYDQWSGIDGKLTQRDMLRLAIDNALKNRPQSLDDLIKLLQDDGYTVKRGTHIALRGEGQKQFIRLRSLGEGYSEEELLAVMQNRREHKPFVKRKYPKRTRRTTLVSELESKINSAKSYWYGQNMKVEKLKQMAKTMVFLEEHGFETLDDLEKAAADSSARFSDIKTKIKAAETRMAEVQALKTHILNYLKTKDIYAGYRKAGYSKKYLAEHEGDIILHKAAKAAFDESWLKKLPTVKSLNAEYAALLSEKKAAYAEYRKAQDEMRELLIHKANAEYVLSSNEKKDKREEIQYE